MSALSDLVHAAPSDERAGMYDALADAALQAFGVMPRDVVFLGHNSGAAFRVESVDGRHLLLKVHAPHGDSAPLSPRAVRGGLQWLADMGERTDIPVQTPLSDGNGELLPIVHFRGLSLACSLQRWLDGQQVEELSLDQARAVGDLMGRWHTFSERHRRATDETVCYDGRHLVRALQDLNALSPTSAMTEDSRRTIGEATAVVCKLVDSLGTSENEFGVVHGDLGPDNIIVADTGRVQFIDLAQLALAPYLWDVGVALYQYSYQGASIRRAMVAAYRGARPGLTIPPLALEAFVCAAALSNLAFQCSIPAQRASNLFHANLRKFATGYCRDLVNGVAFALD